MQSKEIERRFWQLALILLDVISIGFGFLLSRAIRFDEWDFLLLLQKITYDYRFYGILMILFVCNYIFDLYEPKQTNARLFSPLRISFSVLFTVLGTVAFLYAVGSETANLVGRGVLSGAMAFYLASTFIIRFFAEKLVSGINQRRKWLFVLSSDCIKVLEAEFKKVRVVPNHKIVDYKQIKKDDEEWKKLIKQKWTSIVVNGQPPDFVIDDLMTVRLSGRSVTGLQTFYEYNWGKIPIQTLSQSWFTFTEGFNILHSRISVRLKRLMDISLSILLLVISFPVLLLAMLVVFIESPGPVLFHQRRVGMNNSLFTIWKLRTMSLNAEANGPRWAEKNDTRILKVGKFLRKTRLDELPQLINILKGEMSFIGPRPERPEFTAVLREKIPFYDFRHLVKPGLTGWAQTMYSYGSSEEDAVEKLQFELYYIKNFSFELDVKILFRTVSVVLFGAGR